MRGQQQRESALDRFRKKHEEQQAKRGGNYCIHRPEGVDFVDQQSEGDRYFKLIGYTVKDSKHPDAEVGDMAFRRPYGKHKNLGPENSDAVCLNYPGGRKCPPCEERERARARNADKDEVQALNRSQRALYLIIDVEAKTPKLELLDAPDNMGKAPGFGRMIEEESLRLDRASPAPWEPDGPIMEVRFGKDSFQGKTFYPITKLNLIDQDEKRKLPRSCYLDFKGFGPDEVPCLDDALNILDYEALSNLMYGVEDEEREAQGAPTREEEEGAPPESRSRSRRREEQEDPPAEEHPRRGRPAPEPEPEPPADEGPTLERTAEALEEVDDCDHAELMALAEEFGISLDKADVKASAGGDKKTRRQLKTDVKEILEKMLEDGEPVPEPEPPPPPRGRTRAAALAPAAPAPAPRGRAAPPPPAATEGEGTCPHGHEWGEDTDNTPDCKTCDAWPGCVDEYDKRRKTAKK